MYIDVDVCTYTYVCMYVCMYVYGPSLRTLARPGSAFGTRNFQICFREVCLLVPQAGLHKAALRLTGRSDVFAIRSELAYVHPKLCNMAFGLWLLATILHTFRVQVGGIRVPI